MQYLYHDHAGRSSLLLSGDEHRYIFKVRRHKEGEEIALRNLKDNNIHLYLIERLTKKEAYLQLKKSKILIVQARKSLHIGWCIIDPKSVEKTIPSLNEMGVEKITFIYCQRSQKSFKLDFKRLNKILLNSSQQSGRSNLMIVDSSSSLEDFLKKYPKSVMLNFSKNRLNNSSNIESVVVGCEGGFTNQEISLFSKENIVGVDTPLILKSESAVCAVVSKILL